MNSASKYRPIPWFLPAITALMVLSGLFWFGLQEQSLLLKQGIEEAVKKRVWTSEQVAQRITNTLERTKTSAERFSNHLSSALSRPIFGGLTRFDTLFEQLPDGSIRSIKNNYEPLTQAGIWIPNHHQMNTNTKELFVRAKYIVETYGQGAQQQPYVDTWFMPESGGIVIFWPEEKDFIYQAAADFDYNNTDWLLSARPENNPLRKTYWTKLSLDPVPQIWMLSAVSPIYHNDIWLGSVGHDIPLEQILTSTQLLQKQSNSRFILITDKQGVVASDIYVDDIKHSNGNIELSDLPDNNWQRVVKKAQQDNIKVSGHANYQLDNDLFTVSFIKEQDWLLVTSIPLAEIKQKISHTFQNLQNIAIVSISLEIIIVSMILGWGHRRNTLYVNELHTIHNELLQEKMRYQNLVNNIPSMVYRCKNDAKWTMAFINGACSDITGYSAAGFINNKYMEFANIIHLDDREMVWQHAQSALKAKKKYELVYRINHKDSSIHWMLERGQGIFDDDGELLSLEGVITDITKLKNAEFNLQSLNNDLDNKVKARTTDLENANKQLNKQTSELSSSLLQLKQTQKQLVEAEKIASLSHLVVGMAHELNTPLGVILTLLSLLDEQIKAVEEELNHKRLKHQTLQNFIMICTDGITTMYKNTQKLIELSNSFKEIAILDKEKTRKKTNLKNQILIAIAEQKGKLNKKSLTVLVDIDQNIEIESYSTTIFQIFNQLLMNSIVHGYKDKTSGNINIRCDCNKQEVILYYADDGYGIPNDIMGKIFDPFITSARGQGAVGLGLNLVYNLVTVALKGEIECVNLPNGTEFKINIPV